MTTADRRTRAKALGRSLADLVSDPDTFARVLEAGLRDLADPEHAAGQRRVAPGIGPLFGVRRPLLAAVGRGFAHSTRRDRPGPILLVADRLFREPGLEPRWFALGLLEGIVAQDPERSWQLLRRAAREAGDWITVDALAHPVGRGILGEAYRWAELEQLVYSPSRWERRLVGSTIATIPFVDRHRGREPAVAARALPILTNLIGDSEPDVQKALSWALRSLTLVDRPAVERFCDTETEHARETADGHRAWVIRGVLAKLHPTVGRALRIRLDGLRRRAGAPSTSLATVVAARLVGPAGLPNPPLI